MAKEAKEAKATQQLWMSMPFKKEWHQAKAPKVARATGSGGDSAGTSRPLDTVNGVISAGSRTKVNRKDHQQGEC